MSASNNPTPLKLKIEDHSLITAFIDGEFHTANSQDHIQNFYPATNAKIGTIEVSLEKEVDAAIISAKAAQVEWSKLSGVERGRVLFKVAALLRKYNDELATLEVWDTGKPISEANCVDVQSGADAIEYFAGIAGGLSGAHYTLGQDFAYTRREPLGVCAGIGAWNYPLQIACWKAAPALAAGNALIFKPSELTPITAVVLAQIFIEAGAPKGLFNVVQGDHRTGALLASHQDIAKISLTGSVATGKKVMAAASKNLKHVTFELGGKSPLIIFEDADLDNAVKGAILANFYTQGEICTNGTRVFVADSILETFTKKLLKAVEELVIGDPFDSKTTVGTLISKEHCAKVLDYIKIGLSENATLLCGGKSVGDSGNFVEPTVFTNCHDDMQIVKEEIFGPVMCILPFNAGADESVIARANNTQFGLAAGVFTENLTRGHQTAAKLEAGICWINTYNITPIEIPFGGIKQSGIGKENSPAALEHYTQLKTVYVATEKL